MAQGYGQCSWCMGKDGGEKKKKKHEVSVLKHQGNERYVELIACAALKESCDILKVRIKSVVELQYKTEDSSRMRRKVIWPEN